MIEKQKIGVSAAQETLGRIKTSGDLKILKDVEFLVEAVSEALEIKGALFQKLDRICPAETVFATNTSSLPIRKLALFTDRPIHFVGMHFMNPPPVMKLVEVIRGNLTSEETVQLVVNLSRKLGKTPVQANDYPGFIANRILMPMINEAICAFEQGVGSKEDIDTVMKVGMNHPMGPFELADFIGLDVCLAIMRILYDGFQDPKYRPSPLLEKMVELGRLGRKTKKGFYDY